MSNDRKCNSVLVLVSLTASLATACADEARPEATASATSRDTVGGEVDQRIHLYGTTSSDGNWWPSPNPDEGGDNYQHLGVVFDVFQSPVAGGPNVMTPLWLVGDAHGTYYESNSLLPGALSEGSTVMDFLGWLYPSDPGGGAQQVWRCIAPSGRPIVVTTVPDHCTAVNWIVQTSLGWAPPTRSP